MSAKGILVACATFLALGLADAGAAEPWHIIPAESSLSFTGHDKSGGPLAGSFAKLTGSITGDPDHLADSHIQIDVELTSLSADMADTADTLKEDEWFNTAKFPHAVYESRSIVKRPDGRFEAQGDLTLHGMKAPVTLVFALPVYGPKPGAPGIEKAVAKGTAKLSRSAFNVGGPDWAGQIGDAVDIGFTLSAERPAQK